MGTIPNTSLPFNDNATNGDTIDSTAWNQAMQVIQLAVNDNQSQINSIKNAQTTQVVGFGISYPTTPAPSEGQLYFRTDLSQLKIFNGSQWVDTESVVATANGISVNGVNYEVSTSATADTVALRDATGSLTAQTFHGTADNSSQLNGLASTAYLRTDASAPNPQTVANPVTIDQFNTKAITLLDANNNVSGYLFTTSGGGWYFANKANNAATVSVTDSGNATFAGTVTANGDLLTNKGSILDYINRVPASNANYTTISTGWVAVDSTNLTTTMTVPQSGNFLVRVVLYGSSGSSSNIGLLGIVKHGTATPIGNQYNALFSNQDWISLDMVVTGQTPGSSLQLDLAWATGSSSYTCTIYNGPLYPITMEVIAL